MFIPRNRTVLACGLSLIALSAPLTVMAQDADDATAVSDADQIHDDVHDRRVDYQGNIIVTATGLTQLDVLAGTSVFEAADIQENLAGQIGDVLAKLPGDIIATGTPEGVGPITDGDDVRIAIDQIGEMTLKVIQGNRGATEVFAEAYEPPIVKQELTDR